MTAVAVNSAMRITLMLGMCWICRLYLQFHFVARIAPDGSCHFCSIQHSTDIRANAGIYLGATAPFAVMVIVMAALLAGYFGFLKDTLH